MQIASNSKIGIQTRKNSWIYVTDWNVFSFFVLMMRVGSMVTKIKDGGSLTSTDFRYIGSI